MKTQELAIELSNLFGGNGRSTNEQLVLVEELLEKWKKELLRDAHYQIVSIKSLAQSERVRDACRESMKPDA